MTTDPPPTQVIITQQCTVMVGVGGPNCVGTYDTGLPRPGHSGGATFSPTPGSANGATVTNTYYWVKTGGASVTLDAVNAFAKVTNSPSTSSLYYTASAFPVIIKPGGAIQDSSGGWNILVGQGCTASLNISLPTSSRKWTVSGTTFQKWEPTTPAIGTAPANSQASYYQEGPGSLTKSTAHWYWNDPSQMTETISCTATATPPAGQGSPFSITATQKVTVYVPTVTAKNAVGLGYVGLYKDATTLTVFAGPTPAMKNLMEEEGSTWTTSVALPSTPVFSGIGQWGYAQLIKPGEFLTGEGNPQMGATDNGILELDKTFPYMSSTYPADGQQYKNGDSPGLPTANYITQVDLTDSFQTYLMFLPPVGPGAPANDVRWIPLQESDWSTDLHATRPSTGDWGDFPLAQSVGPVNRAFNFQPQHTPPSWTHKKS